MNDSELMECLQTLANDMRRWEAVKHAADTEYPVDARPRTETWNADLHHVLSWRIRNENLLQDYRTMVARRIGQGPATWSAEEMMTLLGEKRAKMQK